jgi:hypothetical protein
MKTHKHWCEIRGHEFLCNKEHEPGYPYVEDGNPIELRSRDCPECNKFNLYGFLTFTLPRALRIARYRSWTFLTRPYWNWRCARLKCEKCGERIPKGCARIYAVLGFPEYTCLKCTPPCPPDCEGCRVEREAREAGGWAISLQHEEQQ